MVAVLMKRSITIRCTRMKTFYHRMLVSSSQKLDSAPENICTALRVGVLAQKSLLRQQTGWLHRRSQDKMLISSISKGEDWDCGIVSPKAVQHAARWWSVGFVAKQELSK